MKLHMIPHTRRGDMACISFTSDARDAATLIHCYLGMTNIVGVTLIRGSRVWHVEQTAYKSAHFNDLIAELFGYDSTPATLTKTLIAEDF